MGIPSMHSLNFPFFKVILYRQSVLMLLQGEISSLKLIEEVNQFYEDFSTLLRQVQEHGGQGLHLGLGTPVGTGHHSAAFDIDEACLPLGLEALGRLAADILAG